MGACMSSVPKVEEPVQKPVEQVQKPAEPAKKLDWGTVGFKTAAISVEVVVGVIRGSVGVTVYAVILGATTVVTGIWIPVYLIPAIIINPLMGGSFWYVIRYAERYWQQIVVETVVDFYELCINRTIGDCVRNVRDIWRIPVYR
jgi:hypothetical protein